MDDRSGCLYNEVVVKSEVWRRHLPATVEAFFYPVGGRVNHKVRHFVG